MKEIERLGSDDWKVIKLIMECSNGYNTEDMDKGIQEMLDDNFSWFDKDTLGDLSIDREFELIIENLEALGVIGEDTTATENQARHCLEPEVIKDYYKQKG